MNDPVRAAQAILASAPLNEMIHEYAAVLAPSFGGIAYDGDPLRPKMNLIGRAITNARSIGGGMCEFEAVNLVARNGEHIRCVAPARIAIHVRTADTVEMVGTVVNGEFNVDRLHPKR